jgi:hypothetical protein
MSLIFVESAIRKRFVGMEWLVSSPTWALGWFFGFGWGQVGFP